ncbi:hypothetical protein BDW74DRAFT_150509 [Aspergillus multicolor]|uniref:uncharacterized protein n=1 Tax=Aspergillus multicolor TaxID=41759 RepID=UPI003CCDDED1
MPGVDRRPLAQTPKAQVLPRAADRRAESSHLPPASPIAGKPQDQKDTTRPTAPTTAENGTGPVDRDLGTGSVSVEDTPPAASTNGDSKAKVKEELDSVPHGSVLNPQGSVPSPRPENPVGTLVDFDCAMDSGSAAAPSPALQELEGLRFTQSSELQSTQSSPSVSTEAKVDLEGTLHKDHPRLSELENQELYKEIAKITNLIKSLPLTNESLPALFALKEILETRLQTPLDQQEDTVQGQQLLTPPGPEHERSKTVASTKALETVSPVAESTPAHSRNTSYSGASTSPCQPRLNAQARQFKPNANPFSTHRSPSHATSDSSVSLPRSPSSEVTAPGSESVLSNGTAIPTIANTPWPEPVRNLINNNPLVYGHLYGDHLLPGQRSILPFAVTLTYSGTANSIYAPKVPNPSTPTFLKPPPTKPIKIVDPKTLVSRVSNRASSAQSAELAKESLTLKPRDAPVPAKKPQQTSLQESIYAPRYKDPKWL